MPIFGNRITSEIIARVFQNADELTRNEIINNAVNTQDERDRVSVLCREIRRRINRNPFIRSMSISAEPIDNQTGDALFVFRYRDEIKIGLVEAKLLRINNRTNLNNTWDWRQGRTNNSHFSVQLNNHQQWINEMAVWCMFIPNCPNGVHSPPLINRGSSNIWSQQMFQHQRVSNPQTLWNYNDVLNLPNNYSYQNLYSIIKSILNCEYGIAKKINGNKSITFNSSLNDSMDIPIPYNYGNIFGDFKRFQAKYKNITSYNYYRFDDLSELVDNYASTKFLSTDSFYSQEDYSFFKNLLDKNIK